MQVTAADEEDMSFEKECKRWSVQKAIQEQVQKEDLYRWATAYTEVSDVPQYVPEVKKVGLAFPLQVLKFIQP